MSLLKHLQECADEMGRELFEAVSDEHIVEYKGHKIEVGYNEHQTRWFGYVRGIGHASTIAGDRDGAIKRAKEKIDQDEGSN